MNEHQPRLPRAIDVGGETIELRAMSAADEVAVLAFAQVVSTHDLLFLARDITHPKVVKAWIRDIEAEIITTLLAWRGEARSSVAPPSSATRWPGPGTSPSFA